jgi:hypothetical protein
LTIVWSLLPYSIWSHNIFSFLKGFLYAHTCVDLSCDHFECTVVQLRCKQLTYCKFNGFNNCTCTLWFIIVVITLGKCAHRTPSGVQESLICIGLMKSIKFWWINHFTVEPQKRWTCVSWIPRSRTVLHMFSEFKNSTSGMRICLVIVYCFSLSHINIC